MGGAGGSASSSYNPAINPALPLLGFKARLTALLALCILHLHWRNLVCFFLNHSLIKNLIFCDKAHNSTFEENRRYYFSSFLFSFCQTLNHQLLAAAEIDPISWCLSFPYLPWEPAGTQGTSGVLGTFYAAVSFQLCCYIIYFSRPSPISPQYLPLEAVRWTYLCLCSVINLSFASIWLANTGCYQGILYPAHSVASSGCCIYLLSVFEGSGGRYSSEMGWRN